MTKGQGALGWGYGLRAERFLWALTFPRGEPDEDHVLRILSRKASLAVPPLDSLDVSKSVPTGKP